MPVTPLSYIVTVVEGEILPGGESVGIGTRRRTVLSVWKIMGAKPRRVKPGSGDGGKTS